MINILITSCGKRVDLIKAFKKAIKKSGKVIITDVGRNVAGRFFADKFYQSPKITSRQYVPFLKKIIVKNRIGLLFTVIDSELPILAKYKKELEKSGCQVMVSSTNAVDIANDKRKMATFLQSIGLKTPQIKKISQIRKFPVFLKPADGSRSLNVHKISNKEELQVYLRNVPNPLVTKFIAGQEYTIDCLCDFEGHVLNIIPRKRIEVRDGISIKSVVDLNKKIIADSKKLLENLPVVGPSTLQCIKTSQGNYFTDLNLRFGGA